LVYRSLRFLCFHFEKPTIFLDLSAATWCLEAIFFTSYITFDIPLFQQSFFVCLFNVFGDDDHLDSPNSLFVRPCARWRTFRTTGEFPEHKGSWCNHKG